MKSIATIVAGLAFLSAGLASLPAYAEPHCDRAYDAAQMAFAVTPAQAEDLVRAWRQISDMELELKGVEFPEDFAPAYAFESQQPHEHFKVDTETGEIVGWSDPEAADIYESNLNGGLPPETKLSQAAQAAASAQFLSVHYPQFNFGLMVRTCPECNVWRKRTAAGVWILRDYGVVVVDEWTGAPTWYRGRYRTAPVSVPTPAVGQRDAAVIALDACGAIEGAAVAFATESLDLMLREDELGGQRLVYAFTIAVHSDPTYTAQDYEAETSGGAPSSAAIVSVEVDAVTGEMSDLDYSGPLGWGPAPAKGRAGKQPFRRFLNKAVLTEPQALGLPQRARLCVSRRGTLLTDFCYPPLVRNGVSYVYVGYLASLMRGTLSWQNKRATIRTASGVFEFASDEAAPASGRRAVNVKGRLFVPTVDACAILNAKAAWENDVKRLTLKL